LIKHFTNIPCDKLTIFRLKVSYFEIPFNLIFLITIGQFLSFCESSLNIFSKKEKRKENVPNVITFSLFTLIFYKELFYKNDIFDTWKRKGRLVAASKPLLSESRPLSFLLILLACFSPSQHYRTVGITISS